MKKLFFLFLVTNLMFFVNCSKNEKETKINSEQNHLCDLSLFNSQGLEMFRKSAHSGEQGLLTSFKALPEMNGTRMQRAFYLDEGQAFKACYLIGNYFPGDSEFKIICLVDYQQVPFCINGEFGLTHLVKIPANTESIFAVHLENLSTGCHDMSLMIFEHPGEHTLDTEFRMQSGKMVMAQRCNITVQNASITLPNFLKLKAKGPAIKVKDLQIKACQNSKLSQLDYEWNVDKDSLVNFNIYAFNNRDSTVSVAIVPFVDFKQISLNAGSAQSVFYVELSPHSQTEINAAFKADLKDEHEFFLLQFESPFIKMEPVPEKITRISMRPRSTTRKLLKEQN